MKLFHMIMYPPLLCGLGLLMTNGGSQFRRIRRESRRRAFPGRPQWQHALIITAIVVGWHGFAGWLALWRGLRLASKASSDNPIHLEKLLPDLLWLIFWLGAQPSGYFAYRLHSLPRSQWEEFVFRQEHGTWQNAFGNGEDGRRKLQDKATFAKQLAEAGLPSVPTTLRWPQGKTLSMKDLTGIGDAFVKPNSANAMRGCLKVVKHEGVLQLSGTDLHGKALAVSGESAVLGSLNQQVHSAECLVQPLLKNHATIKGVLPTESLVTIRAVSICQTEPAILYAVLEVPLKNSNQWVLANIDVTTGEITESRYRPWTETEEKLLARAYEKRIPQWQLCRELIQRAHDLVPDLLTVGWDLTIAESGPVIIEGNSGWDVSAPQMVTGRPLLAEIAPAAAGLPESIT